MKHISHISYKEKLNYAKTGGTLEAYIGNELVAKMDFHIDEPRNLICIKKLGVEDKYLRQGISQKMIKKLIFCRRKELKSGYCLCANAKPFTHEFSLTPEKWSETLIANGVRVERLHERDSEADKNRYKILSECRGILGKFRYWYKFLR